MRSSTPMRPWCGRDKATVAGARTDSPLSFLPVRGWRAESELLRCAIALLC
jgi:hypothetical protein